MRKSISLILLVICCFTGAISVSANENKSINSVLVETRTYSEVLELEEIYYELFPNEYHYIESYQVEGVKQDIEQSDIQVVFEDTKTYNGAEYSLCVYNNGQIFTNISEIIESEMILNRAYPVQEVKKTHQVGTLNKYTTFIVWYTLNPYGYERITDYSVSGSGFYITNMQRKYKQNEDSKGNAYIGYYNVSQYGDGSGILYDIGVMVGNDESKSFCKASTGIDAFLWYMLNTFI